METAIASGLAWLLSQGPGYVAAGWFAYLYLQERRDLRASTEARIEENKETARVLFEAVGTLGRATEAFLHGRAQQ